MDYTAGAIDVPRADFLAALWEHLGPPQPGCGTFTMDHLLDLVGDRRYYCLREDRLAAFSAAYARPRPWIPEVCDCDSKTTCFGADCVDGARELDWSFGLGLVGLNYTSKKLGLPHSTRMSGYHQAPATLIFNGRDLLPRIIQPPHVPSGAPPQPAQIEVPENEMRFWVTARGLT